METINRQEKINHLENMGVVAENEYFTAEIAKNEGWELQDVYPAHLKNLDVSDVAPEGSPARRLKDFSAWLTYSPRAQSLLSSRGTDLSVLTAAYGEDIELNRKQYEVKLPELRDRLGERLQKLTSEGHLPKVMYQRFMAHEKSTHTAIGVFDSTFETAGAFYLSTNHTMYFRPWKRAKFFKMFTHESGHALSGTTTKRDKNQLNSTRTGLGSVVYGDVPVMLHRALNEGLTEYYTNIVMYNNPGKITPETRPANRDTGNYIGERRITEVIAKRVGLDTMLNAYAEDYDPKQPETMKHTRKLLREVRKFYGPGFLHKLDKVDREQGVEAAYEFVRRADTEAVRRGRARKINRALTLVGLRG